MFSLRSTLSKQIYAATQSARRSFASVSTWLQSRQFTGHSIRTASTASTAASICMNSPVYPCGVYANEGSNDARINAQIPGGVM